MHVYDNTSGFILGFAGARGLDSPVHVYGITSGFILGFAGPRGCDVGGAQKSTTKQG